MEATSKGRLRYEVTLPDDRIKSVTLDAAASGYDCIQLVCNSLGVYDESEYFGLTYLGRRGEELWVNSRNQLAEQVPVIRVGSPRRLRLAVRFFVQPHMLVTEETRRLFLLEVRRLGKSGLVIRPLNNDESGGNDGNNGAANSLEAAASQPGYGRHLHPAKDCFRQRRLVGVDAKAVCICDAEGKVLERYPYPHVLRVSKSGRLVYLLISNADGRGRATEIGVRLASRKAATGLYRCVTEVHSFFRCDTVRPGLAEQKRPPTFYRRRSHRLKAALTALVRTEACEEEAARRGETGSCCDVDKAEGKFVFDVRSTAREVHDRARRRQHRHCQAIAATAAGSGSQLSAGSPDAEETVASLADRLDRLLQQGVCQVCADLPTSVVFVPCGHLVACSECAPRLDLCPLCRQPVASRQRCIGDCICL